MYSKRAFLNALDTCKSLTDAEVKLLDIAYSEQEGITAPQVAAAFGYEHFVAANSLVGRLGKKLAKQLSSIHTDDKNFQGWTVLFTGHNDPTKGFVWKLRYGLRKALEETFFLKGNITYVATAKLELEPQETTINEETELYEGAKKQIFVNSYERSSDARLVCIKHYGAICKVCDFDFKKVYGEIGRDYIQVHHLTPLSTIKETYKIDPMTDLIPICPNCHAMIHKRKEPYTIDELKEIMQQNRS